MFTYIYIYIYHYIVYSDIIIILKPFDSINIITYVLS